MKREKFTLKVTFDPDLRYAKVFVGDELIELLSTTVKNGLNVILENHNIHIAISAIANEEN